MRFLVLTLFLALPSASAAFAQCPNDDSLGNNTIATGWPLQPGASVLDAVVFGTGTTNPAVPDPGNDFFLFTLEPGQSVDFDTVFDFSQVALYIQIYQVSGDVFIVGTNPNLRSTAEHIESDRAPAMNASTPPSSESRPRLATRVVAPAGG